MCEILQVIKTFDAEEKNPLKESYSSLREGIELTRSSLEDAYNHNGVKKVGTISMLGPFLWFFLSSE